MNPTSGHIFFGATSGLNKVALKIQKHNVYDNKMRDTN
jgi:hypothetical protein